MNFEDNNKEIINKLEKGILYDVLFKHSPDFFFIHDVYGNLIDVNINLMNALGYKNKTDFLNLSLKDIIFTPDSKSKKFYYQNFLKHIIKKSISTEYMFETKKGEPFNVEGYSVPLNSRDKINQNFFLHISHDITDKKRFLEKLRGAQKELKSITTMIPEIRLWSLTEKKKSINLIKRSSQVIKDSEDKYRIILENIQEGYFELDLNGNFVFFNNAFSTIVEYSNEELIGLHYEKIMNTNTIKLFTQILEESISRTDLQFELIKKKGNKIFVETSFSIKFNSEGEKIGFYGIMRDISERKRVKKLENKFMEKLENEISERTKELHAALERQKLYMNEILRASNFKSKFLSTMSHELRTPLNAIIGFSDLLLEEDYGKLQIKQREYLNDIKISAELLLEMITKILDISKIESGQSNLKFQNFSLKILIDQVNSTIKPLYTKKGLKFKVLGIENDNFLYADPFIFKEILLNLLSNAIKFTDKGTITLRCREKGDHWEFQVKDTGIGIDMEDYDVVFREFGRIENDKIKHVSGAGLGLALTKRLISLHGGEIWFESELGKGTSFIFTIPKRYEEKIKKRG